MFARIKRAIDDPRRILRAIERRIPGVITVGERAKTKKVSFRGLKLFKKQYYGSELDRECLEQEILARNLFSDHSWILPIVETGPNWIAFPYLPNDSRLDNVVDAAKSESDDSIIVRSLSVLLDMHVKGYYHGDFHSKNMFFYNDELLLCDFEIMDTYIKGQRPPFPICYDLTGNEQGIHSLRNPNSPKMFYSAITESKKSLECLTGVPLKNALELFDKFLREELRDACHGFQSKGGRHSAAETQIYCSFSLPNFQVTANETQRNSARRLEKYGVTNDEFKNCSLLDLGCNIGSMIFESQKFKPSRTLGVEYDAAKVHVANRMAAFNGLNNVDFMQGNVDELELNDLGGDPFDAVYCFALIEHLKDRDKLYRFLGEITKKALFFEGNSTTPIKEIELKLKEHGFRELIFVGNCDDDVKPANNCRPMFIARK